MALITTKIVGDQLYIMSNGYTIYKKWIKTGQSMMFHENEGITQTAIEFKRRNK